MRRVLKLVGIVLGSLILVVAALALYVQIGGIPTAEPPNLYMKIVVTPARIANGKRIVSMLCAECHMNNETQTLAGRTLTDAPAMLGMMRSRNITQDPDKGIGKWSDGQLIAMMQTFVKPDGKLNAMMPPIGIHMADEDLHSVIAFLRSDDPLVKATPLDDPDSQPSFFWKAMWRFGVGPFKPQPLRPPISVPNREDKIAFGRYIVLGRAECYGCHNEDISKIVFNDPEKTPDFLGGGGEFHDASGRVIHTANLTADDETGIGKWTESQFIRAVRDGFRPDNAPVRYPMPRFFELTDEELSAAYAYLRQLPKVHKARKTAPAPPPTVAAADGKDAYHKYQCQACHAENGNGQCDLRGAHKKYTIDGDLIAWIRDASKLKPDTKMPTWNGVIAEVDYLPLAQYVRELGGAIKTASR